MKEASFGARMMSSYMISVLFDVIRAQIWDSDLGEYTGRSGERGGSGDFAVEVVDAEVEIVDIASKSLTDESWSKLRLDLQELTDHIGQDQ